MIALSLTWSSGAFAQEVPETAEGGRIEERFEEPVEPRATFEQEVPETAQQLTTEEAEKIKFDLSGLTFEGVTVYESSDFLPFYERYLGREVSLADINKIAGEISNLYLADGYILSFAVVLPQTVRGGHVSRPRNHSQTCPALRHG